MSTLTTEEDFKDRLWTLRAYSNDHQAVIDWLDENWKFCSRCGSEMKWRKGYERHDRSTGDLTYLWTWVCQSFIPVAGYADIRSSHDSYEDFQPLSPKTPSPTPPRTIDTTDTISSTILISIDLESYLTSSYEDEPWDT